MRAGVGHGACGLLLAGILGCGGGAPGQAATLTILDPNFEAIFNPSWDMPAKFTLFEPLVGLDEHGEVEPRLARRWERSADARTWTYHLRTDVRWHDGVPVHGPGPEWQRQRHQQVGPRGRLHPGIAPARRGPQLMPLIARDVPITFFAPNVQHFATHRRVRGLSSPYRADPLTHAEYVWLGPRP